MQNLADKIFFNGKIHSMDSGKNVCQAMAIADGRILDIGSNEEILKLKHEGTFLYDLEGKTVIPGLIDTHTHIFRVSVSELFNEVFMPSSVQELLDYIKERVKTMKPGQWLYFRNIYPTRLKEYRYPTLQELDEAAPNNPVYADGAYAGQANSYALRLLGIDENTPNPPVGRFIRDRETGKLTGGLFLCSHMVQKLVGSNEFTVDDYKKGIQNIQMHYNKFGITSVIDGMTDETHIKAFNELHNEGNLTVRIVMTCLATSMEAGKEKLKRLKSAINTPPEFGKLAFYKIMIDGGILTGTAYMRRPYNDKIGVFGIDIDDFKGLLQRNPEEIVDYIDTAYNSGLQMTAHCIGSGAIDVFLDAYESYNRKNSIHDRRFSILHCDFTDEKTLERIRNLNLFVLFQPAWHYCDADVLSKVIDKDALDSFQPYRLYNEMKINAAAGSDHMIKYDSLKSQNPYNPFHALYNMVTRKTRHGITVGEEHKVSRVEALDFYTGKASAASFDEYLKGTLEVGKVADFAVLSDDYFNCNEEKIKDIEAVLTVVDGKIVYEK